VNISDCISLSAILIMVIAFCCQWHWERNKLRPSIMFFINRDDNLGLVVTIANVGMSPATNVCFTIKPDLTFHLERNVASLRKTAWLDNGIDYLAPTQRQELLTISRTKILTFIPDGKLCLSVSYFDSKGKHRKGFSRIFDFSAYVIETNKCKKGG